MRPIWNETLPDRLRNTLMPSESNGRQRRWSRLPLRLERESPDRRRVHPCLGRGAAALAERPSEHGRSANDNDDEKPDDRADGDGGNGARR
jgi:hypothetical protein